MEVKGELLCTFPALYFSTGLALHGSQFKKCHTYLTLGLGAARKFNQCLKQFELHFLHGTPP